MKSNINKLFLGFLLIFNLGLITTGLVDLGKVQTEEHINLNDVVTLPQTAISTVENIEPIASEIEYETTSITPEVDNLVDEELTEDILDNIEDDKIIEEAVVTVKETHFISSVTEDIFNPSNVQLDDFMKLLIGTQFEGNTSIANAFLTVEETQGINAVILLALAKLEASRTLDSFYALNRNNLFGVYNSSGQVRTYDSYEECIRLVGNLLSGSLYKGSGLITLYDIQPRYCPNTPTWDDLILMIATEDKNKII